MIRTAALTILLTLCLVGCPGVDKGTGPGYVEKEPTLVWYRVNYFKDGSVSRIGRAFMDKSRCETSASKEGDARRKQIRELERTDPDGYELASLKLVSMEICVAGYFIPAQGAVKIIK